jgi:uncharacterized protein YcbX
VSEVGKIGTIAGLWRFPVKSMQGEPVAEVELGVAGIAGDRAYALIDRDTGKVVSGKSVRQFPDVMACRASYLETPRHGGDAPAVSIELSDGSSLRSDQPDADARLSAFFGRDVFLSRRAPDDFTIDMHNPDLGDGAATRREETEVKLGAALFAALGAPSPIPAGAFFDAYPFSLLTTSTLARLRELQPGSRFDDRRFRMNVTVETTGAGFVENDWVGRSLSIGDDGVQVRVRVPGARCVMTTLPQADLPRDLAVLKALATHNRIAIRGLGPSACAGVFATVETPGALRLGAAVALR